MNTQRLANIIVSPRISEKATMKADQYAPIHFYQ